jgi:hypothetical protein
MLAYVFWHRPAEAADRAAYEGALLSFHAALAAEPPPGFLASVVFDRAQQPWFDGYEDWYLVEDWTALGTLNAGAVDAAHRVVHDDVALRSAAGTAAVLALKRGEPGLDHVVAATWGDQAPDGRALWQRQLTLGPAPEFCALHAAPRKGATPRAVLTGG